MNDKALRQHLLNLLKGGNAHITFNDIFPNGEYSSWHLLEHIRRTQSDILEFITSSNYKDKEWPKDYWPSRGEKATKKDWDKTIELWKKDAKALEKIVMDTKIDLYAKIPWGFGQTVLREILLVADHNAYHIGEFAIVRQVMNAWKRA